jgi:hypothetical protein
VHVMDLNCEGGRCMGHSQDRVFKMDIMILAEFRLCGLYGALNISDYITSNYDRLCGLVATHPEVPGSIPRATRFSEKYWVSNGVHSASRV